MSLVKRIAISNGNQERKDEATRLLNQDDQSRHEECNDFWRAEIARLEAEYDEAGLYDDLMVEDGE